MLALVTALSIACLAQSALAQSTLVHEYRIVARYALPGSAFYVTTTAVNDAGVLAGNTSSSKLGPVLQLAPNKTIPFAVGNYRIGSMVAVANNGRAVGWEATDQRRVSFYYDVRTGKRTNLQPGLLVQDINDRSALIHLQSPGGLPFMKVAVGAPSVAVPLPEKGASVHNGKLANDGSSLWLYQSPTTKGGVFEFRGGKSTRIATGVSTILMAGSGVALLNGTKPRIYHRGKTTPLVLPHGAWPLYHIDNAGRVTVWESTTRSHGYVHGGQFVRWQAVLPHGLGELEHADLSAMSDGGTVAWSLDGRRYVNSRTLILKPGKRALALMADPVAFDNNRNRVFAKSKTSRITVRIVGGTPRNAYGLFLVDARTGRVAAPYVIGLLDATGSARFTVPIRGVLNGSYGVQAFALDPRQVTLKSIVRRVVIRD